MKDNLVSVIMPVYNAGTYLEPAVSSILQQTHRNLELIVVDDGSNDSSLEILRQFERNDERVRCIEGGHGGACRARNLAIERARGSWIVAMDADDISVPHRIETLLKAARAHPQVVLWGSYLKRIGPNGEAIGDLRLGPTTIGAFEAIDLTKDSITIFNPTAMFPTELVRQVGGYDERLPAAQESELWDRLVDHGPALVVPEPLLLYRLHENTISFKKQRIQKHLHGFPPARRRARALGVTLDLEEYLSDFDEAVSHREPFAKRMENTSRTHGKMALIRKSEGKHLKAISHAAIAFLAHPKFFMHRARTMNR